MKTAHQYSQLICRGSNSSFCEETVARGGNTICLIPFWWGMSTNENLIIWWNMQFLLSRMNAVKSISDSHNQHNYYQNWLTSSCTRCWTQVIKIPTKIAKICNISSIFRMCISLSTLHTHCLVSASCGHTTNRSDTFNLRLNIWTSALNLPVLIAFNPCKTWTEIFEGKCKIKDIPLAFKTFIYF